MNYDKNIYREIKDINNNNFNFYRNITRLTYRTIGSYQNVWFKLLSPLFSEAPEDYELGEIQGIQRKGRNFLSALCVSSGCDPSTKRDMYEFGRELGFEEDEIEHIVENLSKAELIHRVNDSDKVGVTPYGIKILTGEINVGYAPVL